MSLRQVIAQHEGRLTAADRRLVHVLLSNSTKSAFLSAAELADRAGVHSATAVRLARKLGFGGYPELRAKLQAEIIEASGPAQRVRRRLAHMEEGSILGTLVESEIEALHQLTKHVPQAQIDAAAEALIAAREVFVFGQGNATPLVDLIDRRLRRSGIRTRVLSQRGRDIAERVLVLGRRDAVLAFAFHSIPPGLVPLLQHAAETGATSILVSDVIGPLVRPSPHIILAASRGDQGEFLTNTVPMAICNALVLTISRLDRGTSIQSLAQLTKLIRRFENEEPRGRRANRGKSPP